MRCALQLGVAAFVLLAGQPAGACINSFGTDKQGRQTGMLVPTGDELVATLTSPSQRRAWVVEADKYKDRAINAPSYENATNFGVSLIHQGQYAAAIRLFLKLERSFPGRPETAANLGAALELSGHDTVALKWIRIGIQRDANEHEGTEWLHARILEAKISDAAGHWNRSRSIAGVAFDAALVPALPKSMPAGNDGKPVKPYELDRAFRYQLGERMQFVPPKDWVVANLLSDWAMLNMAGGPLENAKALHGLALRYGETQSLPWSRRIAHVNRVIAKAKEAPAAGFDCPVCEPIRVD